MNIQPFHDLSADHQALLTEAAERTTRALNKVSNPKTSAILTTKNGQHYGNNLFLSNCSLMCAEAAAIAGAVAANDTRIEALYFAVSRDDTKSPKLISPCGNCRQMLHDISRLHGTVIDVFLTTAVLAEVIVTNSEELLPGGFKSASLDTLAKRSAK